MTPKHINAECSNCESLFDIHYLSELTSSEFPKFCPFCGETIGDITEEFDEDTDDENAYGTEEFDENPYRE
jgi:hypothetical protein